jgi:hypothetical protein
MTFTFFIVVNWRDYSQYARLTAGYDYFIGFGRPFTLAVKGGSYDPKLEIVWTGLIADIILMLGSAAIIGWLWRRIESPH